MNASHALPRPRSYGESASPMERLAAVFRGDIDTAVDWVEIISTANNFLVAPTLHREIESMGSPAWVDDDALAYLTDLANANAERNRRLRQQLGEAAAAFRAAGLRPLAIKGAAILARRGKSRLKSRMISDIDLVVEPSAGDAAKDVLEALEYDEVEGTARNHSLGSFHRAHGAGTIDLHQSLPAQFGNILSAADLVAHTKDVPIAGSHLVVPDPSLHLAINLIHDMLHDKACMSGVTELRYLLELSDQLECDTADIDWRFIGELQSNDLFNLAVELQARMAQQLFGKTVPQWENRSKVGALLHKRRLLKARYDLIGKLEWAAVRRLVRLFPADVARPVSFPGPG